MKIKRVLVTGGAGFIGSHLCERLLNDGNTVICLDNYFTGRKENVVHLQNKARFELVQHDITSPFFAEIDEIYNLACPASPYYYQYDPIKTMMTSVYGAVNMLDLAKQTNARILQTSTSEVYGDPIIHPQVETYWGNVNPIGLRSCYDEGKRAAETLFMDYYRQYNLRIKIVRIFNTYGPKLNPLDGRVISNFIVQALKGEDITVYGNGLQTRSFQYIDDLIEGLLRVMSTDDSFTGPVNIGNPHEFTILELVELILKLTKSKSKIVHLSLPKDDPQQRKPDIYLAESQLDNWHPVVTLEDGLMRTIEYFSKSINIGKSNLSSIPIFC